MEQKLDLQTMYRAILDAARSRRYISYGDLAKATGADWKKVRFDMNSQLGNLMELAAKRGWPIPSSIVVSQPNVATGTLDGTAKGGFIAAAKDLGFNVHDPEDFIEEQQQRMFEWALDAPDDLDLPADRANRSPRSMDRSSSGTSVPSSMP